MSKAKTPSKKAIQEHIIKSNLLKNVNATLKRAKIGDVGLTFHSLNLSSVEDANTNANRTCLEWKTVVEHQTDPNTGDDITVIHPVCIRWSNDNS